MFRASEPHNFRNTIINYDISPIIAYSISLTNEKRWNLGINFTSGSWFFSLILLKERSNSLKYYFVPEAGLGMGFGCKINPVDVFSSTLQGQFDIQTVHGADYMISVHDHGDLPALMCGKRNQKKAFHSGIKLALALAGSLQKLSPTRSPKCSHS